MVFLPSAHFGRGDPHEFVNREWNYLPLLKLVMDVLYPPKVDSLIY